LTGVLASSKGISVVLIAFPALGKFLTVDAFTIREEG
jgi:hypothetical protein